MATLTLTPSFMGTNTSGRSLLLDRLVPQQNPMSLGMFAICHHSKVFFGIVRPIAIQVMDVLIRAQGTLQCVFHYPSMLKDTTAFIASRVLRHVEQHIAVRHVAQLGKMARIALAHVLLGSLIPCPSQRYTGADKCITHTRPMGLIDTGYIRTRQALGIHLPEKVWGWKFLAFVRNHRRRLLVGDACLV